jgi:hypothetical protein
LQLLVLLSLWNSDLTVVFPGIFVFLARFTLLIVKVKIELTTLRLGGFSFWNLTRTVLALDLHGMMAI